MQPGRCNQNEVLVDKEQRRRPLIYSQEPKWTRMYVNVDGTFSLTLTGMRKKSHFAEFSDGAASLFNLRQKRWVICAKGPGGLARCFVRGIQLSE